MSSLRLHQVSQRTKDMAEEGAILARAYDCEDSILGRIRRGGETKAHIFTGGGHSLTPHHYPPLIENVVNKASEVQHKVVRTRHFAQLANCLIDQMLRIQSSKPYR